MEKEKSKLVKVANLDLLENLVGVNIASFEKNDTKKRLYQFKSECSISFSKRIFVVSITFFGVPNLVRFGGLSLSADSPKLPAAKIYSFDRAEEGSVQTQNVVYSHPSEQHSPRYTFSVFENLSALRLNISDLVFNYRYVEIEYIEVKDLSGVDSLIEKSLSRLAEIEKRSKNELSALEQTESSLKAKIEESNREYEEIRVGILKRKGEIENLDRNIQDLNESISGRDKDRQSIQSEIELLRRELNRVKQERHDILSSSKELKAEEVALTQRISSLKFEGRELQESVGKLRSFSSQVPKEITEVYRGCNIQIAMYVGLLAISASILFFYVIRNIEKTSIYIARLHDIWSPSGGFLDLLLGRLPLTIAYGILVWGLLYLCHHSIRQIHGSMEKKRALQVVNVLSSTITKDVPSQSLSREDYELQVLKPRIELAKKYFYRYLDFDSDVEADSSKIENRSANILSTLAEGINRHSQTSDK